MMQAAGSFRGTLTKTQMNLPFMVQVARATSSSGSLGPNKTWAMLPAQVACDVLPLKDEMYFLQSGTQGIATLTFHFYAGTDIRVGDRVVMLPPDNVVGMPGSWYDITERMAPSDVLAYIRCFARVTDKPPGV